MMKIESVKYNIHSEKLREIENDHSVFVMIVNDETGNVNEHYFETIEAAQNWCDLVNKLFTR